MTSKAALCKVLLEGKVINIRNIHKYTGFTNAAREIGRSIEREKDGGFGVIVSRTPMEGKNRFKVHCSWVDYKLCKDKSNMKGIRKMEKYLKSQSL